VPQHIRRDDRDATYPSSYHVACPVTHPVTDPVCVIGAGSSGIIAAKVLQERGIPFDCFELGSEVGGLWRFENDTGRSPAYAALTTNTSRDRTGYACFPMPAGDSQFPHNSELRDYFDAFTDHFGIRERIRFRTELIRVRPAAAEAVAAEPRPYDVTVRNLDTGEETTRRYRAVLVASGHHWNPSWPRFPGSRVDAGGRVGRGTGVDAGGVSESGDGFSGVEMHSHVYRSPEDPTPLAGRRVLVVGLGNSACDIACEVAGVAARTLVSTRRGAHVLPRYLLGRPLDHWITPLTSYLPTAAQARIIGALVSLTRGNQERHGVPRPPHRIGQEHPTISQDIVRLTRDGQIRMKPNVERLSGDRVHFVDGSEETVDVVIYATGYDVSFPFLEQVGDSAEGLLPWVSEGGAVPENRVRLYHHVVPPGCPNLFFLGLIQPLGAIPPLAEAQAEWVADLLEGLAELPSRNEMRASIEASDRRLWSRFVESKRHTMEVEPYPYLRALRRERRRGRTRVRAGGVRFTPEVPGFYL
jgi:hypothetical protein